MWPVGHLNNPGREADEAHTESLLKMPYDLGFEVL